MLASVGGLGAPVGVGGVGLVFGCGCCGCFGFWILDLEKLAGRKKSR